MYPGIGVPSVGLESVRKLTSTYRGTPLQLFSFESVNLISVPFGTVYNLRGSPFLSATAGLLYGFPSHFPVKWDERPSLED